MTKGHWLFIGAGVVAMAAVAGAALISGPTIPAGEERHAEAETATTTHATSSAPAAAVKPFEATLDELMVSGKDYGCHYKGTPEEGSMVGTIFVSQGRARGTVVGDVFNSPGSIVYFLLNGEQAYLWYASDTFGKEFDGKALLLQATTTADRQEIRTDLNKNLGMMYGCVPWEFEKNFFELPTDIEFVRLDQE